MAESSSPPVTAPSPASVGDHWANIAPTDDTSRAIIEAARDEFVRFGYRRASMKAIAHQAGVSRVTVHRKFEGKAQLLRTVLMSELATYIALFDSYWYADRPLDERISDLIVFSIKGLRQYPLLNTFLEVDADQVLPLATLGGQTEFELIRDLLSLKITHLMGRGEIPRRDPSRAAELMVRLAYTLALLPFGVIPGQSDDDIRSAVKAFVIPWLRSEKP